LLAINRMGVGRLPAEEEEPRLKVLLVVPYSKCTTRDALDLATPPLGVAYIASYIRKFGNHEVKIHDDLLLRSSDPGLTKTVKDFSPEVVGISGQATPSVYDVYHAARVIKRAAPDALIVAGGAHVTFEDRQVLSDCPEINVIVRGEGEVTMERLLEEYAGNNDFAGVPGITYRLGNSIERNVDAPFIKDLDSLPYPAYDLLDLPRYFVAGHRVATMITSRGCPYNCIFCSSSRIVGKTWRGRTPSNVIGEVQLLEEKYKVQEIEFLDDLFTFDCDRVRRICELLQENHSKVKWTCSTRADILARHPEMVEWLKSGGCNTTYIGAESGSQRILNIIRKGILLDQVKKSVKLVKDAGIHLVLSFVLGIPHETPQEVAATIKMACKLNPDLAQFTVCTPYPGTPLYEEADRNGWLKSNNWKDYSVLSPVMDLPDLPKKVLRKCLSRAYLRFYLRPSFLWKMFREKNVFLLKKTVHSVIAYLKLDNK
jgi:radical SAM superfamily enzyme YgiQ (UPF0313 family)